MDILPTPTQKAHCKTCGRLMPADPVGFNYCDQCVREARESEEIAPLVRDLNVCRNADDLLREARTEITAAFKNRDFATHVYRALSALETLNERIVRFEQWNKREKERA